MDDRYLLLPPPQCLRAGLVVLLKVDVATRAVACGHRRRLREDSLRGPAPPSPHSSNKWSTPSPLHAGVVVDVDYAKDSDEERMAFEMMMRES
jgi:hypothetical protein